MFYVLAVFVLFYFYVNDQRQAIADLLKKKLELYAKRNSQNKTHVKKAQYLRYIPIYNKPSVHFIYI